MSCLLAVVPQECPCPSVGRLWATVPQLGSWSVVCWDSNNFWLIKAVWVFEATQMSGGSYCEYSLSSVGICLKLHLVTPFSCLESLLDQLLGYSSPYFFCDFTDLQTFQRSTSYPFLDSTQSTCAVDLEYNNWVMCCRHTRTDWKSTGIIMFLNCLIPTLSQQMQFFFCGILWLLLLYIHIIWMDCHSLNGYALICICVHLFVYVYAALQNWNRRLWSEQAKKDYCPGLLNRGTSCCANSAVKVS